MPEDELYSYSLFHKDDEVLKASLGFIGGCKSTDLNWSICSRGEMDACPEVPVRLAPQYIIDIVGSEVMSFSHSKAVEIISTNATSFGTGDGYSFNEVVA